MILRETQGGVFKLRSGGVSLGGALSLPLSGLEKDEECPEYRVGLGDRRLALWPIVSQTFVKVAQTGALMQRQ